MVEKAGEELEIRVEASGLAPGGMVTFSGADHNVLV